MQRYKQKNELDESGNISSYAYEMRVDFIPLPCTGEECGPGVMVHAVMRL
ncbi:MAG: hypothetical protein ACLSWY_08610 [Ruthenibacterium lactatiformans]